jgi:hypothetical protein
VGRHELFIEQFARFGGVHRGNECHVLVLQPRIAEA